MRTRPVKSGLRVDVNLTDMNIVGLTKPGKSPPFILQSTKEIGREIPLLQVTFENYPLDSEVDQRIRVRAEPVEIVYHAKTINEVAKCFSLPRSMQLSK